MIHLSPEDQNPVPGEFIIYASPDGKIRLDVHIHDEALRMTQRLKEYMIKGFTIDDERLKNPLIPGTTPTPVPFFSCWMSAAA